MTQGKAATNLVTGVGTFTGTKPVPMPTKVTEDDELRRKEVELKRLKEKEEEAARKREELIKAKAEEQKRYVAISLFGTGLFIVSIHFSESTMLELNEPWNKECFVLSNSERSRNKSWKTRRKKVPI